MIEIGRKQKIYLPDEIKTLINKREKLKQKMAQRTKLDGANRIKRSVKKKLRIYNKEKEENISNNEKYPNDQKKNICWEKSNNTSDR